MKLQWRDFVIVFLLATVVCFIFLISRIKQGPSESSLIESVNALAVEASRYRQEVHEAKAAMPLNWTTCENQDAGYTVSYPASWAVTTFHSESSEPTLCGAANANRELTFVPPNGDIYEKSLGIGFEQVNKPTGFFHEQSQSLEEYLERVGHDPVIQETSLGTFRFSWVENFPNPRVLTYQRGRVYSLSGTNVTPQEFLVFLASFDPF